MGSIPSIELSWMGAQFFVEFEVFSFFEEVDVVGSQQLMFGDGIHGLGNACRWFGDDG
jgi:hypothetical protein